MNAKQSNRQDNLLLYSMICFRDLIEPLLALAKPRSICEIGVEKGLFTRFLLDYCRSHDAGYSGIDPSLEAAFISEHSGDGTAFYRERSLPLLEKLEAYDVYFIDGDHNYYTVKNELRSILRHHDRRPLIFLHDVCWPWGRRDQYCSPESIPAAYRHPCSAELPLVPAGADLQETGFCGNESDYEYAAAIHEGGPRNGVLTAVEDVIAEHDRDNLRLSIVPAVFGLGILYSPTHASPELAGFIARVVDGTNRLYGLLSSLENNRINLFLTYLHQIKQIRTIHRKYTELDDSFSALLSSYQQIENEHGQLLMSYDYLQTAYDERSSEFDALRRNYAELLESYGKLEQTYGDLQRHDRALQAAYDELLRYSKKLESKSAAEGE